MTKQNYILICTGILILVLTLAFVAAAPVGPDSIVLQDNETKSTNNPIMINISGGRLATVNITSTTQDVKWKAFLGKITGTLTLQDATGSTIYNWNLASVTGQIYATRNASTILWTQIQCANTTVLERENYQMNHSNYQDNITRTFNSTNHSTMVIGTTTILNSTCPSLNTFVKNVSNSSFQEIALFDGATESVGSLVYAAKINQNVIGFDGAAYDFQMIVPEIGYTGFNSATPYYMYTEIN
jgi:hypothetical protein